MKPKSTVVLCGQISTYNDEDIPYPPPIPAEVDSFLKQNDIRRERYLVLRYQDRFEEAATNLAMFMMGDPHFGRLQCPLEGLKSAPQAFVDMMAGKNVGKMLVTLK